MQSMPQEGREMQPKVPKRRSKGCQKDAKREPRGSQMEPKGTKERSKGAKRNQKGAKIQPKCIPRTIFGNGRDIGTKKVDSREWVWTVSGANIDEKNNDKINA